MAISAIIGAELPITERLPQKQQMKFMQIPPSNIKNKIFFIISRSIAMREVISRVESNKGKKFATKFASDFARIKISKFSIELRICSIVPSSKSFFKNSADEKIRENNKENQIIIAL